MSCSKLTLLYHASGGYTTAHILDSDGHEYVQKWNLSEAEACAIASYFALNQGAYHPLMQRVRESVQK